ncbi:tyrosine-type recombinase/integrase [Bacillus sp. SD075]|uniref:tyrosine-type recombinase/integrase n=1 Tax=Bacillus sp. SD075 TaxID=2781732 RepID=UPI000DE764B5|nr:tyrosine-type recombinase/integrase [Bacillus sp. SD075]MBO1000545.1 tyrosine-type recombinase/integrase [Bacillus sp. SD075]SSS88423.1 Tyrosine recombinase xerC [Acinetobacter baumannii]
MAYVKKYQTKKGERWMYVVENGIDPQIGNRRRIVKKGFIKQKDAKDALKEFERKTSGKKFEDKNLTFEEVAEDWLDVYSETDVKISTIRVRKHEIGHLNRYFAKYKIKDITKRMYQNALNDLKKKEQLAHNTISGIHGTARMIYKRAMEQDLLLADPTEYAFIPKDKKTVEDIENKKVEDKYFEKYELKAFLDTAKTQGEIDDYVIFLTLSWTGLRAGELVALKWKDIDFEENTINITKTYYNPRNNTKDYKLLPPKTNGSIRKIDVEDEIINTLHKHRLKQKEIKLQVGKEYYDKDFVFGRLNAPYFGYPHFIKTIENRMESLLKKTPAINKRLTPHSLRHTHTSLLAEAGVELLQIMDRLGHTEDETTTQVYLHITKDRKKEASQKFAQLMRSL